MKRFLRSVVFAAASCSLAGSAYSSTLKYQPPVTFSTGAISPHYFAVGDFNGDGKPDLAVPDFAGTTISIYLHQADGSFAAPVITTLSISNTPGAILSGDFNNDGKTDLVVGTFSGSQVAIVCLGNGDGTFVVQSPIPGSFGFLSGKVADFNNDGKQDLFLGGNGSVYLFIGKGDGSFSQGAIPQGSFPGGAYFGMSAGDFNGDKKLDGIGANLMEYASSPGALVFFPGDGNGSLGNSTPFKSSVLQNPASVDIADFNHDGKLDLLLSGNGATAGVLGNGDGTFQLANNQLIPIYAQSSTSSTDDVNAIVADLDQDGHPDAVVLDATVGLLSLSVNDGTGAFPPTLNTPYTYQFATSSYSVATADFNGDGLPDIVLSSTTAKTISLLLSIKTLATPAVSLTSAGNNMLVGSGLMFKATVSGGTASATGTVSLLDGSSQITQQTLDASGTASFSTSTLAAGAHTLTAKYSGDANYAAGTSPSLAQSVTDFQIALASASQTVTAGSAATYMLTVTPIAGFTGTVTLACSGLPSLATCTPPPVTVGSSASTATLLVKTTASTTALSKKVEGITYACLLLGCFSLWGLRKKGLLALLPVFLASLLWAPLGCGGGTKQTIPGTPAGTSTITISATASQNGVTATHTATATLIVQ